MHGHVSLMDANASTLSALILKGDRRGAYRLLKDVCEEKGVGVAYEDFVCPAMQEIGEMWSRDEIGVADEHLATATITAALGGLYRDFPWPAVREPRVIVACPEGERHGLGARMLADLLALDGWDEIYYGGDVPVDTLAAKAAELRPRVVALSVTLVGHLAIASRAARAVRQASPGTKILLGGRAVTSAPDSAASVAADGTAPSAAQGVKLARQWRRPSSEPPR